MITKRSTALADDDLQGWVAQLTLKDVRSVVILDTCYSGKTFVSIPGYLPARTRSLSRHKKEVEYSASLSEEAITDLAQKAKDAKTTRIVIVSASENEESMESLKSNGGLFTQTYIGALRNAHDYADAFDQAKPSVIAARAPVGFAAPACRAGIGGDQDVAGRALWCAGGELSAKQWGAGWRGADCGLAERCRPLGDRRGTRDRNRTGTKRSGLGGF